MVEDWNHDQEVPEYSLSLSISPFSGDAYEPDNMSSWAKTIVPGDVQPRSISPMGDRDWATFTLKEPGAVRAWVDGATVPMVLYLRRLTEEASDLVFLDLPRRVAKVLLGHARGEDGAIRLTLRQEELAHQVGGTRQSVNGALRGFQRRGWIEVRERTVIVTDATALSRFAGS